MEYHIALERPMYGYELAQEMKQRSGGAFTISVLYPVLYRLEEQGYIETSGNTTVDGRARSYYEINRPERNDRFCRVPLASDFYPLTMKSP